MAVKRIINIDFWSDPYVMDNFSVEDKYFMLYLQTNPHTTQLGIYTISKKYIGFETGYSKEVVDVLLQRFEKDYKLIVYSPRTQEISILNSLKESIVKGGKPVLDLLERELSEIKDDSLIKITYHSMLSFWNQSKRQIDKDIKLLFEKEISLRNENDNHNDNENDNENDNSWYESSDESCLSSNESFVNPKDEYINDTFTFFWNAYPRKVGKAIAFNSWKKIKPDEKLFSLIIASLEQHKKTNQWKKSNGEFIPHPSTWLNQRRWEDELTIEVERPVTEQERIMNL